MTRFHRVIAGYGRTDCIRMKTIRQELNIFNILGKIIKYQISWFCHLERRNQSRFVKRSHHYLLKGRRRGRPYKRWRNQFCFEPCNQNNPVRWWWWCDGSDGGDYDDKTGNNDGVVIWVMAANFLFLDKFMFSTYIDNCYCSYKTQIRNVERLRYRSLNIWLS